MYPATLIARLYQATWGQMGVLGAGDVNGQGTLCLSAQHADCLVAPLQRSTLRISTSCSSMVQMALLLHGAAPSYDGTTKHIFQISQRYKKGALSVPTHVLYISTSIRSFIHCI